MSAQAPAVQPRPSQTPARRVGRLEPAALAGVMSRDVVIFGRYWKSTTFSSVVQPAIYLLALGLGLRGLVRLPHYVEYVGTGVVASALIFAALKNVSGPIGVLVRGGNELQVGFHKAGDQFRNVTLTGPADFVFEGTIDV